MTLAFGSGVIYVVRIRVYGFFFGHFVYSGGDLLLAGQGIFEGWCKFQESGKGKWGESWHCRGARKEALGALVPVCEWCLVLWDTVVPQSEYCTPTVDKYFVVSKTREFSSRLSVWSFPQGIPFWLGFSFVPLLFYNITLCHLCQNDHSKTTVKSEAFVLLGL